MFCSISVVSHDSPQLDLRILLPAAFTLRALPFCGRRAAPANMP